MINEFRGKYRFLSNFYPAPVVFEGRAYPTSEHAYVAAKFISQEAREFIASCNSPAEAKKHGRNLTLRLGWEEMKYDVMLTILLDKFTRHEALKGALLATGDEELIEGNWWNDKEWGVCLKTNQGKNMLGKTLMKVREMLTESPVETAMTSRKCSCGKGFCSLVDMKCSNCRTKQEQEDFLAGAVIRAEQVNNAHFRAQRGLVKVAIVGGRDFTNTQYMHQVIMELGQGGVLSENMELVCGMARGADMTGYNLIKPYGNIIHEFHADWNGLGKQAGFVRNGEMANFADAAIAFWDGESKGTKHMITAMVCRNKPVYVARYTR